jgi:FKBP-type peptidyl-prolyl cis-trans isomerase 2
MKGLLTLMMAAALLAGTTTLVLADEATPIADGKKVTMEYKLSVPEKGILMTTEGSEPISYTQGTGQMNPVLEAALSGLKAGESKQVVLTPDQGFGAYDDSKKITVPKEKLPAEIQEGMILQDPMGGLVTVAGIANDSVVLDLNHPFAGQNLVLDVHILNVEGQSDSK